MPGTPEGVELDNSLSGLDEIIDRALDGEPSPPAPKPAAEEPEEIDDEPEEESDEDSEDVEEDVDDEAGDDELEDEYEDDEEEDEEGEEEEEDEGDEDEEEEEGEDESFLNVSDKQLKRIRSDPDLAQLEKVMQRSLHAKTTQLAEARREFEDQQTEWRERVDITEQFREKVKTPEGMARYLAATMEKHPMIVGAAFETVAIGEKAKDFLIAVGEHQPEVFEQAYEELQELLVDEDARKRYHRAREFKTKEAEIEAREMELRRRQYNRDYHTLWKTVEQEAKKHKLDDDDLKEVERRLAERLESHIQSDGRITMRPDDAKQVVKETRDLLDRQYERALKKLGKKKVKESREATKKKARVAKTTPGRKPPRSAPQKTPREHSRFKHDGKGDPVDAFIDHRLRT